MLARGSGPFVGIPLCFFLAFLALRVFFGWVFIVPTIIFLVILVFMLMFFRDPQRNIGDGIVAPADGVIQKVEYADGQARIVTFMNIHNVHVNRCPASGRVKKVERGKGGFAPAYAKGAALNEQVRITLETDIGEVRIVQIVGAVARRIVPYVKEGQSLSKGERIGMIRFGSRVDVCLPKDRVRIQVKAGQRVRAGETTVAIPDVQMG